MCTVGNYSKYIVYMAENAIHVHMHRRQVPLQHIQNKLYMCQPLPPPTIPTSFTKQNVCD